MVRAFSLSLGFPLVVVEVDALLVVSYLIFLLVLVQVHPGLICLVDIIASLCWRESTHVNHDIREANKWMDAFSCLRRFQLVDLFFFSFTLGFSLGFFFIFDNSEEVCIHLVLNSVDLFSIFLRKKVDTHILLHIFLHT